jgi:hypothetical protein
LKVDWHAQDSRHVWNHHVTTHYMMAQGFVYGFFKFNPTEWRGLVDFGHIWKIQRFPRTDFDILR